MTIIPLGRALPRASSHLPADSVGHVDVCLFGVAPRRDCPFHPRRRQPQTCRGGPSWTRLC